MIGTFISRVQDFSEIAAIQAELVERDIQAVIQRDGGFVLFYANGRTRRPKVEIADQDLAWLVEQVLLGQAGEGWSRTRHQMALIHDLGEGICDKHLDFLRTSGRDPRKVQEAVRRVWNALPCAQ